MKRLSLIGMAGIGKSYWAAKLEAEGFRRFCCDDLIAGKLGPQLVRSDGAIMTMGEWMGFPFHEQYEGGEHKYLSYEIEVLDEVLACLGDSESPPEENTVVDTSGSVIYTGQERLEALRRLTTVVYLKTPPEVQRQLLTAYVTHPHPMIWKGMFNKKPKETNEQALERCYPQLLVARQRMYELFADVTIDYYKCRQKDFGVRELLEVVDETGGKKR